MNNLIEEFYSKIHDPKEFRNILLRHKRIERSNFKLERIYESRDQETGEISLIPYADNRSNVANNGGAWMTIPNIFFSSLIDNQSGPIHSSANIVITKFITEYLEIYKNLHPEEYQNQIELLTLITEGFNSLIDSSTYLQNFVQGHYNPHINDELHKKLESEWIFCDVTLERLVNAGEIEYNAVNDFNNFIHLMTYNPKTISTHLQALETLSPFEGSVSIVFSFPGNRYVHASPVFSHESSRSGRSICKHCLDGNSNFKLVNENADSGIKQEGHFFKSYTPTVGAYPKSIDIEMINYNTAVHIDRKNQGYFTGNLQSLYHVDKDGNEIGKCNCCTPIINNPKVHRTLFDTVQLDNIVTFNELSVINQTVTMSSNINLANTLLYSILKKLNKDSAWATLKSLHFGQNPFSTVYECSLGIDIFFIRLMKKDIDAAFELYFKWCRDYMYTLHFLVHPSSSSFYNSGLPYFLNSITQFLVSVDRNRIIEFCKEYPQFSPLLHFYDLEVYEDGEVLFNDEKKIRSQRVPCSVSEFARESIQGNAIREVITEPTNPKSLEFQKWFEGLEIKHFNSHVKEFIRFFFYDNQRYFHLFDDSKALFLDYKEHPDATFDNRRTGSILTDLGSSIYEKNCISTFINYKGFTSNFYHPVHKERIAFYDGVKTFVEEKANIKNPHLEYYTKETPGGFSMTTYGKLPQWEIPGDEIHKKRSELEFQRIVPSFRTLEAITYLLTHLRYGKSL